MPVPIAKLVERLEQQGMPLARRQRADAQQVQRVVRHRRCGAALRVRAAARFAPIHAGLDDAQLTDRDAFRRERASRPLARGDDALRVRQRAALGGREALRGDGIETGLERDGMMDECDELEAPCFIGEQAIEPGQREAVDDDDAAGLDACEGRPRRAQRRRRWRREAPVERVDRDANPALRQAGDDLAIVDVAAGRRLDVAGNDEVDAAHAPLAINASPRLRRRPMRRAIHAASRASS